MPDFGALAQNYGALNQSFGALSMPAAQPDLLEQARQKYPYLRQQNINYTVSPAQQSGGRMLEFWHPKEEGDSQYPRPAALPMGTPGIEVFQGQKASPTDVLADYVSHYGVNEDPRLKALYEEFKGAVPDKTMRDRYDYHAKNYGEKRPYDQWLESSGMPELFRGYTFNQWGDNAKDYYSPEQIEILDKVRNYLGVR